MATEYHRHYYRRVVSRMKKYNIIDGELVESKFGEWVLTEDMLKYLEKMKKELDAKEIDEHNRNDCTDAECDICDEYYQKSYSRHIRK